jgi:protein-tyrosine-phosphatase
MGGSSLRVSAPLDAERLAACQRMLGEVSYTGVAMFEFRQNIETGRWVLLEVNARFWGSLPLPLSLGMDFPYDLLRILSGETEIDRRTYRPGIRGRNLTSDLNAQLQHRSENSEPGTRLSLVREVLSAMLSLISGKERSDALVADDPFPGVIELNRLARAAVARVLRLLERRLPGHAFFRQRRIRRALERRRPDAPVLFLCQGNICRSPFAHHLLERELREHTCVSSVASAGLIPLPDRKCPDEALRAASRYGIDLRGHVSRFFDEGSLARAGIIFVFDRSILEEFRDRFPATSTPVFPLSQLLDAESSFDIEDPLGKGPECFAATYERIEQAVRQLVRQMRLACA